MHAFRQPAPPAQKPPRCPGLDARILLIVLGAAALIILVATQYAIQIKSAFAYRDSLRAVTEKAFAARFPVPKTEAPAALATPPLTRSLPIARLVSLIEEPANHTPEPGRPVITKKVYVRRGVTPNVNQVALMNFPLGGQVAAHSHKNMTETFLVLRGRPVFSLTYPPGVAKPELPLPGSGGGDVTVDVNAADGTTKVGFAASPGDVVSVPTNVHHAITAVPPFPDGAAAEDVELYVVTVQS